MVNNNDYKTLESPLDYKEIQPVHSEGDQPWDFFGGNDAEAETPVLWPPHAKSWLIAKDSDAGRGLGQEEKRMTEDEMAGRHQPLDAHEFGWTPGDGDGQEGLACCEFMGSQRDGHDWVTKLNWTEPHVGNIAHLPFHILSPSNTMLWMACMTCLITCPSSGFCWGSPMNSSN